MKIGWTPPVRPAGQRRDDKGVSADRPFTAELSNEPAARASVGAAAALSTVEGLLSVQEVDDGSGRRRRMLRRGERLLDALDELRHAMLVGGLPREQVIGLRRLAAEAAGTTDDPRLQELIAEIELRVVVELAKLGEFV
ncbi:MAG: flagellar assembly protein FliX [Stellaceae bacterium]